METHLPNVGNTSPEIIHCDNPALVGIGIAIIRAFMFLGFMAGLYVGVLL